MKIMNCYVCDIKLTQENTGNEHIIINALGGRLKSKNLLCKSCNSTFGDKIDIALANSLKDIGNMLNIKRERGKVQDIIGKNNDLREFIFSANGRIKPREALIEYNGNIIRVGGENKKQIANALGKLKSKYPSLKVEKSLDSVVFKDESFSEKIYFDKFDLKSKEILQAICKCAINFYVYKTSDSAYIKHLLPYINNKEEKKVANLHYMDNLYKLNKDELFHILHLVGDSIEKVLYVYVDYFNFHKFLVILNDNYLGDNIQYTYCYDLINYKEIDKKVNIKYTRKELFEFMNIGINEEVYRKNFKHIMRLSKIKKENLLLDDIINKAFEVIKNKYPQEELFLPYMKDELLNEIMQNIEYFLLKEVLSYDCKLLESVRHYTDYACIDRQ